MMENMKFSFDWVKIEDASFWVPAPALATWRRPFLGCDSVAKKRTPHAVDERDDRAAGASQG
jgi:hypothetical protein